MPRALTHSSCCPQPEARGRQLQAGCRAGSSFLEPTSHLGLQGKNNHGARSKAGRANSQVSLGTALSRLPREPLGRVRARLAHRAGKERVSA